MKFRICVIALVLIASAALVVRAFRLSQQEQQVVKTEQSTVKIFNNTIDGRWINVPIEITSLGANNYRVTNKTRMGIRRFIIALYAAQIGKPAHGEGSKRHFVPVRIMDRPIAAGQWIDINIEEHLKEFGGGQHNHAADMNRIEMLPYIVDFDNEHTNKRWRGGDYLRAIDNGWEKDPDLNPKENKDLIGASSSTASCYVYGYPVYNGCLQCSAGDACDSLSCRKPVFNFKFNRGGVQLGEACVRCTLADAQGQCDEFGSQCAHDDGSPCEPTTLDLDYNAPC